MLYIFIILIIIEVFLNLKTKMFFSIISHDKMNYVNYDICSMKCRLTDVLDDVMKFVGNNERKRKFLLFNSNLPNPV